MSRQRPDKVDHPIHYGGKDNPYEAIKVIEAWQAGFNVGNALKYICRAGKKEEKEGITGPDYKKACWYLLRELALREGCMDPNHYTDLLKAAEPGLTVPGRGDQLSGFKEIKRGDSVLVTIRRPATDSEIEAEDEVLVSEPQEWTAAAPPGCVTEAQYAAVRDELLRRQAEIDEVKAALSKDFVVVHGTVVKSVELLIKDALHVQKDRDKLREALARKRSESENLNEQIDRLADWIMANIHGEPSRSEGAVDTAIRIMGSNLGELGSLRDVSGRTEHQQRVERMMVGFKHSVPIKPMDPGPETRVLRARLIMEECLETIQDGLRVEVGVRVEVGEGDKSVDFAIDFDSLVFVAKDGPADLIELADGCADVSVVTIGTLSAFGIKDRALLEEVDANNLSKIDTGRTNEHGKFTKHPDHMPPRIAMVLMAQGWQNPDEPF